MAAERIRGRLFTPSVTAPKQASDAAPPPSYIGLPQRFCKAKDLWEEGEGGKEIRRTPIMRKRALL